MKDELLKVFEDALRLKRTVRSGWPYYGIKDAESVADHSFGVAFVTLLLGKILKSQGIEIDMEKALAMAIIHEIGESRLGDLHLESRRHLGKETVRQAEESAVRDVFSQLGHLGDELTAIWKEFEDGQTTEAILVRAADKVELMLQALEYEKAGYRNLDLIFSAPENSLFFDKFGLVRELVESILSARTRLRAQS